MHSVTLDADGLSLSGIRNGNTASPVKALCLHGWLDNAHSFLPLMPSLPAIDLVAIDLPGHGHSDHAPGGYDFADTAWRCLACLDHLNWTEAHLIGHSLGACIAPFIAVANPARIRSMCLIDGLGPISEEATGFPDRLRRALSDRSVPEKFISRRLASKDDAVDSRLRAATMARHSARLIIDRQVISDGDGYRWRFDPKLRHTTSRYLTEAQVQALLRAIRCPTLTIRASDGFLAGRKETEARLDCLSDNRRVDLVGHHHLHMDSPDPVAAAINAFLGTPPARDG